MMDDLEMPEPLTGPGIQCQQAISEQICALTVGPVEVICRRSEGEVGDAPFLVYRHPAPGICAADILPRVLRPRFIPELTGMRDGVEAPDQLAGLHIVSADVSGGRSIHFAGRGTQDDHVLEYPARRPALNVPNGFGVPAQILAKVYSPVVTEG